MQTHIPGSPFLKDIVGIYDAAGRVGDQHRDTIYQSFAFVLPEIGQYIADQGVVLIACRAIRDVYPQSNDEGVLGFYVENEGEKFIIIPEYVRYGKELHPAWDVQNTVLHELGHALAFAFQKDKKFALHDRTEFIRAVERDRAVAAGLTELARQHEGFVNPSFMDIQLDKKYGHREIFANIMVYIATGMHIENGMKEFPHALRAVMNILRRENLLHSMPGGIENEIIASTRYQGFADPLDRGPQYGDNLQQIPAWHSLRVREAYVETSPPLSRMLMSMYHKMARTIEGPLSRSVKPVAYSEDTMETAPPQSRDKVRSPHDWQNDQSQRRYRLAL